MPVQSLLETLASPFLRSEVEAFEGHNASAPGHILSARERRAHWHMNRCSVASIWHTHRDDQGDGYRRVIERGPRMEISARNQLPGTVKSVKLGAVMAEVVIEVNGLEVVSAITRSSAEAMGLKEGDQVKAIIKSTEVMVGK